MSVPEVAQIEDAGDAPDVSGVPSAQLKALYEQYVDTDPEAFAERVGLDYNYFVRLCVNPVVPVVRLKLADEILMGLGLNVSECERDGQITIVPLNKSRSAAQRMADSQIAGMREDLETFGSVWVGEEEITREDAETMGVLSEETRQEIVVSLMEKYAEHCGTLTPRQEQERERARLRMATLRAKKSS